VQAKDLTAVFMIIALAAGFATESAAEGTCGAECTSTTGTTTPGTEDPEPKGNNGWGNGEDGVNPGTDNGNARQVSTKENTDPPQYDQDKVDRFGGR
jgi:hypothetical protein